MTVDPGAMDAAEREAMRRFAEAAEEFRQNLIEAWGNVLPGNHSPAEAALLAHLITMIDGYNSVCQVGEWKDRHMSGRQTTVCYLASVEDRLIVDFAVEARSGNNARQLAILIDDHRPGERTAEKRAKESRLVALGFRVMVFSETEALSGGEDCRERVEAVIFHMIEEAMADDDTIKRRLCHD